MLWHQYKADLACTSFGVDGIGHVGLKQIEDRSHVRRSLGSSKVSSRSSVRGITVGQYFLEVSSFREAPTVAKVLATRL